MTIRYYMAVDGLNGTSDTVNGWFDLTGVAMGAALPIDEALFVGGAPHLTDVFVGMEGMAPTLLTRLAAGTLIEAVRIQARDDVTGEVVYDLRLGDVRIVSDAITGADGSPYNNLALHYEKVALITDDQSFGFDTRTNTAINPNSIPLPDIGANGGGEDAAVAQYYLIIDGVNGVGTSSKGWFEIESMGFGASTSVMSGGGGGGGTSAPEFSALSVDFYGIAPDLLARLTNGTTTSAVRIEGVDAKGAIIYDLRLGDVKIIESEYAISDAGAPVSSLTFDYSKIGLITNDGSFGYNVATHAAIDPSAMAVPISTITGSGVAPGAVKYYLAIDGVKGGSTTMAGWFDLNSVDFSAFTMGGGVSFGDLSVTTTGVTTQLLSALVNGTTYTSARIEGVDAKGAIVYDVRLGDVRLTNDTTIFSDGERPVNALNLDFEKIGIITARSSYGYDLGTHATISAASIATPTPATSGGASAVSAINYYLIIDGVNGGSSTLKGAFDIDSVGLSLSKFNIGETPSFGDLNLILNGVTPALLTRLAGDTNIASARIQGLDAKGATVYDLRLADIQVQDAGITGFDDMALQTQVSLNYARVGLITPTGSFGYDLSNNTSLTATSLGTPNPASAAGTTTGTVMKYLLTIDTINGGGGVGTQIEVPFFDIGMGDGGTFRDLRVSLEGLAPNILALLANGTELNAVRLQGFDSASTQIYDLRLNDVYVSQSSTGLGEGLATTSLSFQFDKIGLITPTGSFGFNEMGFTVAPETLALPTTGTATAPEKGTPTDFYLAIDGITPDSSDFSDWIALSSASFAAQLFVAGETAEPYLSDITVAMQGLTPALLTLLTNGDAAVAARIVGTDSTGKVLYDIRMSDVLISADTFSGSDGPAYSAISLHARKIGYITAASRFGFDTVEKESINLDTIYMLGDVLTLADGGATATWNGASAYDEIIGGSGADTVTLNVPTDGTQVNVTATAGHTKVAVDIAKPGSVNPELTVSGVETLVINGRSVNVTGSLAGTGLTTLRFNAVAGFNNVFDTSGLTGVAVLAQGNNGNDSVYSGDGNDTLIGAAGSDFLSGFQGHDSLSGGDRWDTLIGAAGNDTLNGGLDNDLMYGGMGDDLYYVDNTGDRTIENLGEGNDSVISSISWALSADVENLTLIGAAVNGTGNGLANRIIGNDLANSLSGGASADTIDGGAGSDTIDGGIGNDSLLGGARWDTIYGGDGNDTIDGGTENDQMYGGLGDDVYYVDNAGDRVNEATGGNEGIDTVYSTVTWNMSANVEHVVFTGSGHTASVGNSLHNTMNGNAGNNTLSGGSGHDTINGGDGNDSIDGGTESDVVDGGNGNDTILGGQRWDTLTGGAGDDVLDGGTENDRMTGGTGNDAYYIDNVGDRAIELAGEGNDTVYASIDWAMAPDIEDLVLQGPALIGSGNGLNNRITGNANANTLNGGNGNDTLTGGLGNDSLTGGTGRDDFVFGAAGANGFDEISDFLHTIDRLVFKASDYGFAAGYRLTASQFTAGTTAVGSSAQFIWDAATGQLSWDADGTGAAARVTLAELDGAVTVTKEDLYFTA